VRPVSSTFFTSDTHFGHKRMLDFRPFVSTEEMDEALIANWNERIGRGDRVYHLGDFSFANKERTAEIIGRLNGQIHLVRGNHDKMLDRCASLFASFQEYKTVKVDGQRLVLFHFAMRTWDLSHHGSWSLYGHSHGNLADDPGAMSMDVGVDPNGLRPVAFEEVAERMAAKVFVPVDHHGMG
jgi:calcineurin-like phosphoesterase family protein